MNRLRDGWAIRIGDSHSAPLDARGPVVSIRSGGLASSSTTVRRWRAGGTELHHIVDPRTGEPAPRAWRTVSVAAASLRRRQHGEHGCDRARSVSACMARGASAAGTPRRRDRPNDLRRRLASRGGVTLLASNGQALWYLTRGSGAVALVLLTASVLLGVMNSTRWRTTSWPRFLTFGLHRNVTLLAIAFTAIHVVTTIADSFAPIGWIDSVIPFLSPYRPFWLGLGTVAFDLLLALTITSFLRRRIGVRVWRLVHWLAYASWPVALLHSLGTGSDARTGWLAVLGVVSGVLVFAAVVWRVWDARDGLPLVRAGAVITGVAVLVGLLVWARGGPLEKGWAARAGTPASILSRWAPASIAAAAPRRPSRPRLWLRRSLPAGSTPRCRALSRRCRPQTASSRS